MKKLLVIFSIATMCMAQTKIDSTEVINLQSRLEQIKSSIVTLQSEVYEREKQLKELYTNYSYLTDVLKLKKELLDEKKKE